MKRINSIVGVLLFSVVLLSCEKGSTTNPPQTTPVVSYTIGQNCLYGNADEGFTEENLVINDLVAWNTFKAQMNTVNEATNDFSELEVDFSQWTVLVSLDQVRPTGGFGINYSSIVENDENVIAAIDAVSPEGFVTMVITQPYVVVKIPKTTKPVIFN